ncbi:metal-dependent hydrolase [Methanosarcina mazei]|jgi:hypothetical protein|uniref:Metal-dependent hydrolase n=7 Tax=Methanosarcina mazei TaxID=2209 RepID=A0A0F8IKD8_METMZ|nr:metal-dependent hydrolase [Methanosarcina mazei]AAM31333.1 conserved protein [Methanosarcina mazei Go1]AKB41944.1 hypothetical protein MSMAW_2953 [Methanosarcina mazei WWM610]AKB62878.1 hypothetical protein MSMAP_2893 [Methanosarcina mazei SarPi]AKB66228.1 hypothetical protein MSMAS_3032 [Methanosarcina mazei S-6]AKB68652.1 hypothetical protein MSMAL_2109 [Methanosarcina mazei LYC]
MPYPVVHILFFVFCVSAVAVYATFRSISQRQATFGSSLNLLLLLLVGSVCTLLPDVMIIYNLFVNGTIEYCWIGSIPTHSLLFSFSAIVLGTFAGYVVYQKVAKAIYLGLFGEVAFSTHLLLDDACGASCYYFYPVYSERISIFPFMNISFLETGVLNYLIISFVSVSFLCLLIMMALYSLHHFGFEFKYEFKG